MTELIWDGKYDAQGHKVAPPRIALPFQTVETVNESAADRDRIVPQRKRPIDAIHVRVDKGRHSRRANLSRSRG